MFEKFIVVLFKISKFMLVKESDWRLTDKVASKSKKELCKLLQSIDSMETSMSFCYNFISVDVEEKEAIFNHFQAIRSNVNKYLYS